MIIDFVATHIHSRSSFSPPHTRNPTQDPFRPEAIDGKSALVCRHQMYSRH
jgi:hypothetical protein